MLPALVTAALVQQAAAGLGPGRGAWQAADPSAFGLSATHLRTASTELHAAAAIRNCTLVIKNGYIVHEQYDSWSDTQSTFESDSMGKTAVAAIIGLAEYRGLLDIDKPIASYTNISDQLAVWNATGENFFPQLTVRHLLSQASGYGRVAPGSFFTYDSDDYIQYLSYVLGAVTGEEPVTWVTREFATPMGLTTLFMFDGLPTGDISAGGGQLYTCRDAARIGQLIASGGLWAAPDGSPMRMMSAEFARGFITPQYPQNNAAYGFLTWLNTDVEATTPGLHCCAPRWGHAGFLCRSTTPVRADCVQCCRPRNAGKIVASKMCNLNSTSLNEADAKVRISAGEPRDQWMERVGSAYIERQMIGDNLAGGQQASATTGVAMGLDARYILFDPAQNLTIVSIGSAKGWSTDCWGGYDDAYTVGLLWNILGPAVTPAPADESAAATDATAAAAAATRAEERAAAEKEEGRLERARAQELAEARGAGGEPYLLRSDPDGRLALIERSEREAAALRVEHEGVAWQGSCSCYCKAEEGRGICFNIAASVGAVNTSASDVCKEIAGVKDKNNDGSFYYKQGDYCTPLGTPVQCDPTTDKGDKQFCSAPAGGDSAPGGQLQRACAPVSGNPTLHSANCVERYDTWAGKCQWASSPCGSLSINAPPYIMPGRPVRHSSDDHDDD